MERLDFFAPSVALGFNRYKVILRLAIPTVIAMLSQSVVNDVDVIYFSRLPCPASSNAQAALLPALILTWMFGGSLAATGVGTQALVARRYAEGDRPAAGAVLANASFFCIVAGAAMSVIGVLLLPTMVRSMITVPEVQGVAIAYTRWRMFGVISMGWSMAIKAFFDGIGKTYVHLVSAVFMNTINIFLCWVLIFGHLGVPAMGAPGAGLSAFLSTWIGLGILVGYAVFERRGFLPLRVSNLSLKGTWAILKLSIPAALTTVVMMVGFGLFARAVGRLDNGVVGSPRVIAGQCGGTEAVNSAANTDIVEILKLTFTACMAFGTSTATLIGQSLGRHRPDEAQRWGWASVRLGVVLFGVVGLCEGALFPHAIVGFVSNSPAVQAAAIFPLRIMGLATPVIAIAMILSEGLFGAGETKFVALAQFLLIFGWLVPGAYVFGLTLHMCLNGIWIVAFVYVCLAAVTMSTKFARGAWMKIQL